MKKGILILMTFILAAVFFPRARAQEDPGFENAKDLFREVQLFADSITLISSDYVESVKVKDLVYGAIRGMMDTLDGYSTFLDPEDFKEISEETRGKFGGIGIEIGVRDGILTVIAPIADTPAQRAGLESGDMIVKIEDEVTRDLTLDDAVKKLRGKPGTEVKISVIREGTDKILDFNIQRAEIKMRSIKRSEIIEDGIAYIRVQEFQEPTAGDLKRSINGLREEGARSLILDVRNNPGGLLDASIEVSELFLDPGAVIVLVENRDPAKKQVFKAKKRSLFSDMELIVLVNKGSASASEIFAGAIKDNRRGLLVGEQTFGKGSVQTVIPLKDASALRLTTAAYLTPSGKNLRDKGVEPDIAVPLMEAAPKEDGGIQRQEQDRKERVFEKVDRKKDERAEDEADDSVMDSQVQAAVNVIKGVRIFTGRVGEGSNTSEEQ